MKEMIFTVYPDGRPSQLTINGVSGPGCKDELQRVIQHMGGAEQIAARVAAEVVSEEPTAEMYQAEPQALKQEG